MSLNRQTLSAPSVGGGSTSPYVTIYDNASVTPQAALWTIVDGRVTQVGLDVRATTGTTAITTAQGLTFDGDFDLSPIGATLATFASRGGSYDTFAPGALANLSFVNFSGDPIFLVLGPSFNTLNLGGCTNALTVYLGNTVTTSLTLPLSLFSLVIANVQGLQMAYPPISVANSSVETVSIGNADFTSLNVSGCINLQSLAVSDSNLTSVTLTTLPEAVEINFVNCALNVATVNALLVAADANGLLSGAMNLSGGTSAAPTGAGITAAANLVSKGWTVATN